MSGLLCALTQLIRIWWTKDRIRVARSEGKLLRIQVGDRLLIEDKVLKVVARHDSDSAEGAHVVYSLVEEQGETDDAWVLSFTAQCQSASLSHCTETLEIGCNQVVVLKY